MIWGYESYMSVPVQPPTCCFDVTQNSLIIFKTFIFLRNKQMNKNIIFELFLLCLLMPTCLHFQPSPRKKTVPVSSFLYYGPRGVPQKPPKHQSF